MDRTWKSQADFFKLRSKAPDGITVNHSLFNVIQYTDKVILRMLDHC